MCNLYTWFRIRIQQLKLIRIPCPSLGQTGLQLQATHLLSFSHIFYPAPGGPVQCDPTKQRRCGDGMRCYDLAKHCDFNVCIPRFCLLIIAVLYKR
jgi:hypothetical protein